VITHTAVVALIDQQSMIYLGGIIMANMKSTLAALWTTTQSVLDTTTEVVRAGSVGINELSDRTHDWAKISRLDRESSFEARLKDKLADRAIELAKAQHKRNQMVSKDAELSAVYSEIQSEMNEKLSELL